MNFTSSSAQYGLVHIALRPPPNPHTANPLKSFEIFSNLLKLTHRGIEIHSDRGSQHMPKPRFLNLPIGWKGQWGSPRLTMHTPEVCAFSGLSATFGRK